MYSFDDIFGRSRLLLGADVMERLSRTRIIVFGVGGVGSWCVESLVRTGLCHITMVDSDRVAVSNINRQLMATTQTVGRIKVEEMKRHLLEINPEADIDSRFEPFNSLTADTFDFDSYDYMVDAIDSIDDKVLLIDRATEAGSILFSSMGAALKLDPTKVKVAEFGKVTGCPLARALRQRFKKRQQWPKRKFICVYSDEQPRRLSCSAPSADRSTPRVATPNGSLMHVTAMFGLTIAGLIIEDICRKAIVNC